MPVRPGPTASWIEPDIAPEAYVDWARGRIAEHGIDIFVPTRHRRLLAGVDLGCRVVVPAAPEVLELLDDKLAFAEALRGEDFHLPTWPVAGSAELRARLDQPADGAGFCVKPRFGVNGHGFWKLAGDASLAHLMLPEARKIRPDMFLAALDAAERDGPVGPFVLMPWLPGPEVSFDVLALGGTVLRALARTKDGDRQHIQSDHPLLAEVGRLVARFALDGLVNIQFRRAADESWKVLEINARPAGGSVYAEDFGGRLVSDWGGLLTGRLIPAGIDRTPLDLVVEFSRTMVRVS